MHVDVMDWIREVLSVLPTSGVPAWAFGLAALGMAATMGCSSSGDKRARTLIEDHLARAKDLEIEVGRLWWKASVSGAEEDFRAKEEAENSLNAVLSDPAAFARIEEVREGGGIEDAGLRRQVEVLYLAYLGKQVDAELLRQMTAKSNQVEKIFNTFRAQVGDRRLTENDLRTILKESRDSTEREAAWKAAKEVGSKVEGLLKELVDLRNRQARKLGYRDYYALSLALNEQDEAEVLRLFEDLDALTGSAFREAKAEVDRRLAARYRVKPEQLRPWHYDDPFFQEAPRIEEVRLDALYRDRDLAVIARDFYKSVGLGVEDVLARSSLYEQEGKSPHAFCIDIDRAGDVRILTNIRPSDYWMDTVMHELGHAVYSKYLGADLPYLLRTEAHILTTEAIAMMFGRLPKRGPWLRSALGLGQVEAERTAAAAGRMLRLSSLIFSRWCQVMLHFERALYGDPEQDLNALWWDLVEKYQGIARPEGRDAPDYASKIHFVVAPVYYHNYMMGELLASQIHHAIARETPSDYPVSVVYSGDERVGAFLRERVFGPGKSLSWNELTTYATGESLTPKYYAGDFVQ